MYLLHYHPNGVKALHTEMGSPSRSRRASEIAALRLRLIAEKPEGDQALAFIVERIRTSTRATAAVIALADGDEIVCRASSGNAPSVGARVDPDSGLSGECVRTGKIVRCDDTETDPRADHLVCRHLDLRSMVIVPIRIQGRPAGILEVFSSRPHAFKSADERVLGHVADLVAEIALRQPKAAPPPSSPKVISAARMKPFPAESQVEEEAAPSIKEILATPMEEQAAPSPTIAQEAGKTDKPQPEWEPSTAAPKQAQPEAEPAAFLASIMTPHCTEQLLTGASKRVAGLASAAAQRITPLRMKIAGVGILVTVLLVGGWQRWRAITPSKSAPMGTQQSQPAANAPARLLAANTTTAPVNAAPAQPKPAKRARSITLPPPDMNNSAAPPVIALVAHPAGEASPISNLLALPVAAPKLDIPYVSQTSGGKLIRKVDPIYPKSLALYGEVVLKATINRKGQVTKVNVVRGQAVLARAAVAAVSRWSYEPFLLNGVPIEVENDIVVNFKAPGQ